MSQKVIDAAIALSRQGVAVIPLHARTKRPVGDGWQLRPRNMPDDCPKVFAADRNLGIRTGAPSTIAGLYALVIIDLDIPYDDPDEVDEAHVWLDGHIPEWRDGAKVISGSGGASRHIYLLADGDPKGIHTIAQSERTVKAPNGKTKQTWSVALYGVGGQIAAPPSIHPDTGREYAWEAGCAPAFRKLPVLTLRRVEKLWGPRAAHVASPADRDPVTLEELRFLLDTTPLANEGAGFSYEDWLAVVFAVHHGYAGTDEEDEAYDILAEWSERSDKHTDKWLAHTWRHARSDRPGAVTMGTVIAKAGAEWVERKQAETRARVEATLAVEMVDERTPERIAENGNRPRREATERADPSKHWTRGMDLSADGAMTPLPTLKNLQFAIRHEPVLKTHLVYDVAARKLFWQPAPDGSWPKVLRDALGAVNVDPDTEVEFDSDDHPMVIHNVLAEHSLPAWKFTDIRAAAHNVVPERRVNRMERALRAAAGNAVWRDGDYDYAGRILIDVFGVEDTPMNRDISRAFFVGMALRVLWPGAIIRFVLFLVGAQGLNKSGFFKRICHWGNYVYHADEAFDLSDVKEVVEIMTGTAIVELGEGVAVDKRSAEEFKQFSLKNTDKTRLKHGAGFAKVYPRTASVVVSANKLQLPPDETGNRRCVPLFCMEVGDDFVGVPNDTPLRGCKKSMNDVEKDRPMFLAQIIALAERIIAAYQADPSDVAPSVEVPMEHRLALKQIQQQFTPENQTASWAAIVAEHMMQAVPAQRAFGNRRVPKEFDGMMLRRQHLNMREFAEDVLLLKKSEVWRQTSALSHAFARAGLKKPPNAITSGGRVQRVWRVEGSMGEWEIVCREVDYDPETHGPRADDSGPAMTDERPRRNRRNRDDLI